MRAKTSGEAVQTITILPSDDGVDKGPYAKVFKLFASKVLEDLGTMNVEAKILLWMLSQRALMPMQASGYIDCPQELLGQALGCSREAVNRGMKKLRDKGYLEQRRANVATWRIKPDLVYRGSLSNYWKNMTPAQPLDSVDVWCPWSETDYAKMKAGERPLLLEPTKAANAS